MISSQVIALLSEQSIQKKLKISSTDLVNTEVETKYELEVDCSCF